MSQLLKDILKDKQDENNKMLKTFYTISFMTGVNIKYKAQFMDPIKMYVS